MWFLHAHTQSGRIVNQMTEASQRKKKKNRQHNHGHTVHANPTNLRGSLPNCLVFYRLPILDVFLPI